MVKGGGHGNYRNFVVAPASVQEMADLTILAFELADNYRNPAIVLTDGFVGQMMEPLDLEYREIVPPPKPWAVKGTAGTRQNMISSIFLEADDLEEHQRRMEAKYIRAQQAETRCEEYRTEDAELVVVGYGIVSRVLRSAVDEARKQVEETLIPVEETVQSACEILGLDPLYVANEGRFAVFVPAAQADKTLNVLKKVEVSQGAVRVGTVEETPGRTVVLQSRIGGNRVVDMLSGEQLPRIC
jgi:TPP-dependent indolepyruvate ferredoxin oxidoreductase alpha subunit